MEPVSQHNASLPAQAAHLGGVRDLHARHHRLRRAFDGRRQDRDAFHLDVPRGHRPFELQHGRGDRIRAPDSRGGGVSRGRAESRCGAYVVRHAPFEIRRNGVRDALAYVASILASVAIVLPLASFALVSFVRKYPVDLSFTLDNIGRSLNLNVGDYWLNSIFVALSVAVLGTVLAYFAGYITARMGGKFARVLHLVCITTLAIPGIVLGLSYVGFFKDTFIYGTFALLILVNLIHFFASPYLMAYNSLGKVNANLEAVGATLGIGRMSMIKDVLIPQTVDTVLEMFAYFFVNCMVTISAVAFLATTLDMPLALLITDLDTQRLTECAAFVSLVILVTNIVVKSLLAGVKKIVSRKQRLESANG